METANPFSLAFKFVMQDQRRVWFGTNFAPTTKANLFRSSARLPMNYEVFPSDGWEWELFLALCEHWGLFPLVLSSVSFLGLG